MMVARKKGLGVRASRLALTREHLSMRGPGVRGNWP